MTNPLNQALLSTDPELVKQVRAFQKGKITTVGGKKMLTGLEDAFNVFEKKGQKSRSQMKVLS